MTELLESTMSHTSIKVLNMGLIRDLSEEAEGKMLGTSLARGHVPKMKEVQTAVVEAASIYLQQMNSYCKLWKNLRWKNTTLKLIQEFILREALQVTSSFRQLLNKPGLNVNPFHVRTFLQNISLFTYIKEFWGLLLSDDHKKSRLVWASFRLRCKCSQRAQVIFYDEKN